MKQLSILFAVALFLAAPGAPARAQSDDFSEGLGLFLDGLREGMDDTIRDLQDLAELAEPAMREFLREMGPALSDLADQVQDWTRYEPPVMLPNGDIVIRRKPNPRSDENIPAPNEPTPPMPQPQAEPSDGPIDI